LMCGTDFWRRSPLNFDTKIVLFLSMLISLAVARDIH
jgi:hypothetical protein